MKAGTGLPFNVENNAVHLYIIYSHGAGFDLSGI